MESWSEVRVPKVVGQGIDVRLFDTSAQAIRPVSVGPTATMYVCGITPYDATHMGHAATYLTFDLVNRLWRDAGRTVKYVQNVTDVDDPLLERATATGTDWRELALAETQTFREDMVALRILPPDHFVGAVEAIPVIAQTIEQLRARNATYLVDQDLYFSVAADRRFGSVSGLDRAQMLELFAERGGDPDRGGKKDPLDPVIWLAPRPGEPTWSSSLGEGRPGWHVECTAIATHYLGMPIDVQGGGSDLAFPHHEMSASHGQVATDEWPFARHYVHAGMVGYQGHKMSKSRGNLVLVRDLRAEGIDPMAIRLALLGHHFRPDWEWTNKDLVSSQARLQRWRAASRMRSSTPTESVIARIRECLSDDLNTQGALRAVDEWALVVSQRGDRRDLASSDPLTPAIGLTTAIDALLGVAL